MGEKDKDTAPQAHSFLTGFENWAYMWRFCIAIGIIFLSVVFSAAAALRVFGISIATKELTISAGGETQGKITSIDLSTAGLSFKTAGDRSTHVVFVPGNVLWIDTHIDVPSGYDVRVTAQGSVTLSNQLVDKQTSRPHEVNLATFNFVVDPSGESVNAREVAERQADILRDELRILPGARLGTLLAAVTPRSAAPALGKRNPRPAAEGDLLVAVGRGPTNFRYADGRSRDGRLYFSVNDILAENNPALRDVWLLKRAANDVEAVKEAYLAGDATAEDVNKQMADLANRWDASVKGNYTEVFFEDNSGFFIVIVELCPEKCA